MKNWKTTLCGIVLAIATFGGPAFGLSERSTQVAQGLVVALGLSAAKDHNVTGGTKEQ